MGWATFSLTDDLPGSEAIRTGVPVLLRTPAERDVRFPVFRSTPVVDNHAFAVFPVDVRGCLVAGFLDQHALDGVQRRLLEDLTRLAGDALYRFGS